jgi:anti-sigma factor RsiW
MHAVLDGEATPPEARELDAILARDAKARAEFDELRSLFDGLAAVPQRFPPEGLVAAVTARLGEIPATGTDADQLFARSGVFGASSKDVRGVTPGNKVKVDRVFPLWAFFRGDTMSENTSGFSGKRKILIGGGIAVAAVAVAVSTGLVPPSTDTAGTIVPAERYRAPQITADDIKLGNKTNATPVAQSDAAAGQGLNGLGTNGQGSTNGLGTNGQGSTNGQGRTNGQGATNAISN